jgi:hypothetical protein
MNPIMKRLIVLTLVGGLLAVVGLAVRYELKLKAREKLEAEAHKKREASYALSLLTYSQALKPGMNRKEVEDYLKKKNLPVLALCCVDGSESDLIRIGQDDDTWFCAENYVYIALQFDDEAGHRAEYDTDVRDADVHAILKSITIFHMPGRCL